VEFHKFFIVGCPRSGTTLLQQALNRHSQIAIPPETNFFSCAAYSRRLQLEHLGRVRDDLEIALALPVSRLQKSAHIAAYYALICRLYAERLGKRNVTHFGDKSPEHLSRLNLIQRVLPGSKVIMLCRDGRDVALSLRELPWTSRDLYVNFALWMYCQHLRRKAGRVCGLPVLTVRYEDLVNEPERALRVVLDFMGLKYEATVAEGAGNSAGIPFWELGWKGRAVGRITKDRVDLWRKALTGREIGILERWGGHDLRMLGYPLLTGGGHKLPWFFRAHVALKSALWLAMRPRYGKQKILWLKRQRQRCLLKRDGWCV
jgi:hypothetical protein